MVAAVVVVVVVVVVEVVEAANLFYRVYAWLTSFVSPYCV